MIRQLGANGPKVYPIGLGCMSFGGFSGATTETASFAAMDAAWDIGITFFDTANVYGPHTSETVIGRWIAARGHTPVLASKAGITRDPDRPANNSLDHIEAELDGTLARLGVDHLPLLYIHRREKAVPIEDLAGSMGQLIDSGKIGGWGLSEVAPATIRRAHAVTPLRAVQNEYSLWTRQPELGVVQTCNRLGIAFVPFSPLGRGAFGDPPMSADHPDLGAFRQEVPRFQGQNWQENAAHLAKFRGLAADHGVGSASLALGWVLAQGSGLIPIPGSRSSDHIRTWQGATDIAQNLDLIAAVDACLPLGWVAGDRYSEAQALLPERYC